MQSNQSAADALHRLARTRDLEAWAALLELHGPEIQAVCRRILNDASLAEDACQETLLQLRDRAGQFKGEGAGAESAARNWIMKTACNTALQMLRSRKSSRKRDENAGRDRAGGSPREDDPRHEQIRTELAGMPEHDRLPIVLHYYGGLDYARMSTALGCPEGTAKARVHRGVEKLRKRLALLGVILALGQLEGMLSSVHAAAGDSTIDPASMKQWSELLQSPRRPSFSIENSNQGGLSIVAKIGISCAIFLLAMGAGLFAVHSYGAEAAPPGIRPVQPLRETAGKNAADLAAAPAAADELAAAVRANNAFAFELYSKLAPEGNLFFSGYSISTALAMAYAGANGDTAGEMKQALRFDLGPERTHPAMAALLASHGPREGGKRPYQLDIANRLWGAAGFEFLPEFQALTKKFYGAELESLDFVRDAEGARRTINQWIEKRTQEKIKDLIGPGALRDTTRLVLTNAIYFKSNWTHVFPVEDTREGTFTLARGEEIDVPMMALERNFNYCEADGFKAVELPYAGGEMAMTIFLPDRAGGLGDFEKRMTPENVAGWLDKLKQTKISLAMPKFKLTWGTQDLVPHLKSMGVKLAFEQERADFSGMTKRGKLHISQVLHKAFVEVSETGTEAAAATAVRMDGKGKVQRPPPMHVNHPFFFMIRDTRDGSILFMGRVADPR